MPRLRLSAIHDLPLRTKIIVPVVLVEIAVFLAAMRVSITSVKRVAEEGLHAEARARLRLLSAAYLQMALTGEQEYYRDLVNVVSRSPDVVAVDMESAAGTVPADTAISLQSGIHQYTAWERVQVFGHATDVAITYTDRSVVESVADARTRYVWLLGLAVLLTTAVLWAAILAITEPLTRVAEAAERFAEGSEPPSFSIKRRDEVGMLSRVFEATAEKLHAAQLQLKQLVVERTRQLEAMFHNTPVGVLQIGTDRTIRAVNPMMADLIGLPAESIVGRPCYAVLGSPQPCEACVLHKNDRAISRHTWTLHPGTREERVLETTVVKVRTANDQDETIMELAHDVTEERRLHEQLLQSSKLASIGQLASGIAHEINNPLATIRLRCDSLVAGLEDLDMPNDTCEDIRRDILDDVAAIERQAERVSTITRELLTFSRCSASDRQAVDIHEVIASSFVLVGHKATKQDITLVRDDADDLPNVYANRTQLEQVLVNLLNNAMDASMAGDAVTVATRLVEGSVELSVIDSGKGIPENDLERIFDPFYTTKDVGEGTGLGLSISYGIVAAHGGTIDVKSRPGDGATVSVRLPAVGTVVERAAMP